MGFRSFLLDSAAIAKIAFRRYFAPLSLSMGGYRSYFSTGERTLDVAQIDRSEAPSVTPDDVGLKEVGNLRTPVQTDVIQEIDDPTAALGYLEVSSSSIEVDGTSEDLSDAGTITEIGTKLDLARAYVDLGNPARARSILEEVLNEGDEGDKKRARNLLRIISA